jgi:plastocyanin
MKTKIRATLVASLVVASIAFPALSWGAPVRIRATAEDTWNPSYQHVSPGTRVVWVNADTEAHDLTAYGRNWSKRVILQPEQRTAKTFRNTGTYKYFCRLHGHRADGECHGMCGVVHVMR